MISELTEITEEPEALPFRGWIFFDEDCGFCRDLALRFERAFAERRFYLEPLQRKWVQERLDLTREQPLEEMRVLTADGQIFGGVDAVVFLARQLWWATPFAALARFASVHLLLDRGYRWIAAYRSCAMNRETSPSLPARTRWLGLIVLPLFALALKAVLPAWAFMWIMAFAIFFGCKWLTLGIAASRNQPVCPFRATAYLFAWPGMDATRFLSSDLAPHFPRSMALKNVVAAIVRILIGTLLLFAFARHAQDPILAGWIGMAGIILILHFGLFSLVSVGWRVPGAKISQRKTVTPPYRNEHNPRQRISILVHNRA